MPFLPLLAGLWGNPLSRIIIVAVAAFGFGFLKGFQSVPRVDIAAVQRVAIESRDNHWRTELQTKEREHETELTAAIAERDATPAVAADADLAQLCRKSSSCRDKSR